MDKILFIIPPNIDFSNFIAPSINVKAVVKKDAIYGGVPTDMPLGVLSISAYVKKYAEVETKLVDFNVALNKLECFSYSSFKDFFHDILSSPEYAYYRPDIVGISTLFTTAYRNMLDVAQCCRDLFPYAVIVAGGGVPTNLHKEIFESNNSFDGLCYGEGEKPMLALIRATNKTQCLEENSSWITPKKSRGGQFFRHDFIENLDEIPFYDYDICEMENYGLNPAMTSYASVADERNNNFHVMTSRGCPHRCCFCSSHTVHGRQMRYYSLNRVREDFKRLKEQYGARTFVFQDDHLMADKQRALEIINIVKDLQVTVIFQNSLAMYALDRKMLQSLKGAGVNQLVLAIESGSNRVLKEIMHKPITLSMVKQVTDACWELGIYTNANILIGLPGETKSDIEDTRAFLKTINVNS